MIAGGGQGDLHADAVGAADADDLDPLAGLRVDGDEPAEVVLVVGLGLAGVLQLPHDAGEGDPVAVGDAGPFRLDFAHCGLLTRPGRGPRPRG